MKSLRRSLLCIEFLYARTYRMQTHIILRSHVGFLSAASALAHPPRLHPLASPAGEITPRYYKKMYPLTKMFDPL